MHVARFAMRQFLRLFLILAAAVSGTSLLPAFALAEDCQSLLDEFNRTIDSGDDEPSAKACRQDCDQRRLWPISGAGAATASCAASQCRTADDGPRSSRCGLRALALGRAIARGAVASLGDRRRGAVRRTTICRGGAGLRSRHRDYQKRDPLRPLLRRNSTSKD